MFHNTNMLFLTYDHHLLLHIETFQSKFIFKFATKQERTHVIDMTMRCCPLPLLLDSIQFSTTVHLTHSWSSVFPHGHVSCVTTLKSPHIINSFIFTIQKLYVPSIYKNHFMTICYFIDIGYSLKE